MEGQVPLLNVMTLPPGATQTQARLVFDGVRGAIFLYSAGGPTGALVGSWAISAGTDPYGNPYPQGFAVNQGIFETSNATLNDAGLFIYSPTKGAGNLLVSIAAHGATDAYGNVYLAGISVYAGRFAITILNNFISFSYSPTPNPGAVWTPGSAISAAGTGRGLQLNIANTPNDLTLFNNDNSAQNLINVTANGLLTTSPPDGNLYIAGSLTRQVDSVGIGGTGFTGLFVFFVFAGITYQLQIRGVYIPAQSAGQPVFGWHGGGPIPPSFGYVAFNNTVFSSYSGTIPGDVAGPVMTLNQPTLYTAYIRFNAPTTGTIGFAAATSNASDTYTIQFLDMTMTPIG